MSAYIPYRKINTIFAYLFSHLCTQKWTDYFVPAIMMSIIDTEVSRNDMTSGFTVDGLLGSKRTK